MIKIINESKKDIIKSIYDNYNNRLLKIIENKENEILNHIEDSSLLWSKAGNDSMTNDASISSPQQNGNAQNNPDTAGLPGQSN